MTIEEFATVVGYKINIEYNISCQIWHAKFDGEWVKKGKILQGVYGKGDTPNIALSEYARLISGQTLIFNEYDKNRKEITVPKSVS